MDDSFFQVMAKKLNGRNYWEWAQSIKLVVEGKGKIRYLTGDAKQSKNVNLQKRWKSESSVVMAGLVNSIGKTY